MLARQSIFVALFALSGWGQPADKVLYFNHLDSPQAMQEVSNVVRSISDISNASLDVANRSLLVKGTADQVAMAGWLTGEMDKTGSTPGTRELPFNDPSAPLAQIVYLSHVDRPQDFQEIVNVVRSVVDVQRCFPMNQQKAIVMRGLPDQMKAADWLIGVLDQPANGQTAAAANEYRLSAADISNVRGGLVVQVAAITHLDTPNAIQEATNLIRSIANVQRCFPVFSQRSVVIRADDDQIALARWLLKLLDGPGGQGTQEFKVGGSGNEVAQVAYIQAATPQTLVDTVNEIRSQTKLQRVFPFHPQGAVALRGTADQLALAQQVIQSRKGQ